MKIDIVVYIYLKIQKAAFEKIYLNADKMVFLIKIIDLDTELFTKKTIVGLVFEIDGGNIHTAITLMN